MYGEMLTGKIRYFITVLMVTGLFNVKLNAQTDSTFNLDAIGLFPKEPPSDLQKISISGFYRFFATQTRQFIPYLIYPASGQTVPTNQLFIGDDTQLPTLQLNIAGRPNSHTSWAFDIYTFQYLNSLGLGLQSLRKAPSRVHSTTEGFFFAGNVQLHTVSNSRK